MSKRKVPLAAATRRDLEAERLSRLPGSATLVARGHPSLGLGSWVRRATPVQIGQYGVASRLRHTRHFRDRLAEVTPVRGDDEKYTRESERDACDDPSSATKFELRDLGRGEPDPSEQDE